MRWWPFGRKERAAGPPVSFVSEATRYFGPGATHQADHETLLRENLGLADAATRAIANRVSTLELQVVTDRVKQDGTVDTEILDNHPLKMLVDRPHPNISYRNLMRLTTQWIVTTGEAYWLKVGSGMGVPVELHPYPPGLVEPLVRQGVVESYQITDGDGRQYERPADEVVRHYFPDPENPWRAEGYLGPSAITLDAHKFASQHLRAHYQYDATPKVVLQADKDAELPDTEERQKFSQQWTESYHGRIGGPEKGTPRILPPGWSANQLDSAASEATRAYLETWREELLMMIGGVPQSILGNVRSGDRSSAETNQWVFDLYAISPIALLIEDSATLQLAGDFEGDVRLQFAPFVSDDKEFELKREAHDLEHAIRTPNKVLIDREDDPVEWGDDPIIASKLGKYDPNAEASDLPQDDDSEDEPVPMDEEAADEIEAAADEDPERMARALHIQVRKLERAAKRMKKVKRRPRRELH